MKLSPLLTFVFLFVGLNVSAPAHAAMTGWEDLGGGKARLIANLDPKTMKVDAALEVRLEEGWSTYWRYPGSSGIPPMFDFTQSVGFMHEGVQYPVPKLQGDGKQRYAGYKKSVTFPVNGRLIAATGGKIKLNILMGVCEEICIPAQASFEINGRDLLQSDFRANSIIALARSQVPETREAQGVLLARTITDDQKLELKVRHGKLSKEPALFVEGPSDWYLTPARVISSSATETTFSLDISNAPAGADFLKTPLTYTLYNGGRGIEFSD